MGGHTTVGEVLSVGLSVTGFAPSKENIWRNAALSEGDALILTRPLGTGALFHADMAGLVGGEAVQGALKWMMRGNGPAARALRPLSPSAVTDVTGFGLAGHLIEMLRPKDLSAVLQASTLPFLPGVRQLMDWGERSTFMNRTVSTCSRSSGPRSVGLPWSCSLTPKPEAACSWLAQPQQYRPPWPQIGRAHV